MYLKKKTFQKRHITYLPKLSSFLYSSFLKNILYFYKSFPIKKLVIYSKKTWCIVCRLISMVTTTHWFCLSFLSDRVESVWQAGLPGTLKLEASNLYTLLLNFYIKDAEAPLGWHRVGHHAELLHSQCVWWLRLMVWLILSVRQSSHVGRVIYKKVKEVNTCSYFSF